MKLCSEKRGVDTRLAVITQLRQSYQKPVIALTGVPLRYTEENTKEAGASFLFALPVEGRPLMDPVKQCFEETEPATFEAPIPSVPLSPWQDANQILG